jgi:hypothetical protein
MTLSLQLDGHAIGRVLSFLDVPELIISSSVCNLWQKLLPEAVRGSTEGWAKKILNSCKDMYSGKPVDLRWAVNASRLILSNMNSILLKQPNLNITLAEIRGAAAAFAAKLGFNETARWFLNRPILSVEDHGYVFSIAASMKHIDICQAIIDDHGGPSKTYSRGVFHTACGERNIEALRMLVKNNLLSDRDRKAAIERMG